MATSGRGRSQLSPSSAVRTRQRGSRAKAVPFTLVLFQNRSRSLGRSPRILLEDFTVLAEMAVRMEPELGARH